MMKLIFIFISLFLVVHALAQNDKKLVRKGNKEYTNKKFNEAEVDFRKALEEQGSYIPTATYNLGNALYRQNKFDEAVNAYTHAADAKIDKKDIAKAYHNLGNTYLQMQKFQESIDAYKKALRNNPNDMESKYNLAVAQKLLKDKPQNKQNQQNQQDKNNQGQQNQPQNNNQDQNKQEQQQQQPQQQQGQMSKEQAQQLLRAIQDDENNTQEKVKKEKAKGQKTNPEKDW
ncbi:MAG TPA: tetratricopeptide repeat protein [Bacteroidales bacterium]|nr:tetratricopeptide repeat protein [Bacteroidales bacterium]